VRVESQTGQFLGWAAFSPTSRIRARIWSFQSEERIDAAFFEKQVAAAVAMRARLQVPSNGVRLIHGEADGLPGLIVDSYDDTLVAQFLSAGTDLFKAEIVKALVLHTGAKRVFERSDSGVRALEGLGPVTGWLYRAEGSSDAPVANLSVEGVTLAHTAPTFMKPFAMPSGGDFSVRLDAALVLRGTVGARVRGCSFVGLGGNALLKWLGEQGECFVDGDREDRCLIGKGARVLALEDVGPVAPILGRDHDAVGRICTEFTRQREQLHGGVELDRHLGDL
jgi:hypothetical protein